MYSIEWIPLQHYSGLVPYSLLGYQFIYYVVQNGLQYFMRRLPLDAGCL
jgi:hypothetical protein